MEKKDVNVVIQSSENALGLAILRRGIGTGKAKGNTVSSKVHTQSVVVKLFAVVRVKGNEEKLKLSSDKGVKRQ